MIITIPAACLEVLGGLMEADGFITCASRHGSTGRYPASPAMGRPYAESVVVVLPASSAAVAAVLARSLGYLPDPHARHCGYEWAVEIRHDGEDVRLHLSAGGEWSKMLWGLPRRACTEGFDYAPITGALNAHHALAQAAVWQARIRRAEASGLGWHEDNLRALERDLGLPEWTVEVVP